MQELNSNNMATAMDLIIDRLPEIEDILDLKVPATFVLVKPYYIFKDKEEKSGSGIYMPNRTLVNALEQKKATPDDIPESSLLSKGVVVAVGKRCDEITAGMEVFFYKGAGHTKGAFTSKNEDGEKEIYQLYQEYDIHAYL